jgi:hypothetical protein
VHREIGEIRSQGDRETGSQGGREDQGGQNIGSQGVRGDQERPESSVHREFRESREATIHQFSGRSREAKRDLGDRRAGCIVAEGHAPETSFVSGAPL